MTSKPTIRNQFYGPVAAAMTVGISLRQLYYWVDVLRVVTPRDQQHGQRIFRRFSTEDVARLKRVKRFLEQGYTLRAAVGLAKRRR